TGRHRRVPAVPGDQPLQPRDLRRLPGQLLLQLRVLRTQLLILRPQPPVRVLQPGDHVRHIGRIGHTGTTPEPALSKQHDTPSRPTSTIPNHTSQPGKAEWRDLNAYPPSWGTRHYRSAQIGGYACGLPGD